MEQDYDQEQTGVATEPTAIQVVTEDYWLPFRVPTGLMPDRQFDGRPARLHVHRVYPKNTVTGMSVAEDAVVLIHGRTVPGPVVFDLQDPTPGLNLSLQKALASASIDTFAPSLLGYGRSTRFDEGLNDPGNASLGACPDVGCDRTLNEAINPYDQQGTMLLGGRPLVERRRHPSTYRFARTDVWVRDIDQLIDHARSKLPDTAPDKKVALVGYSLGGQHVGRTLYKDNLNEQLLYADDRLYAGGLFNEELHNREEVIDKVSRVVFVNSIFFPLAPTEDPANPIPTFPLTLNGKTTPVIGSDANWQMPTGVPDTACHGRVISGTQQQVWDQTMEHETVGRAWGTPWSPPPATAGREGGLNRAPTFSGYGWNRAVAGQLSKPTLVVQGLVDGALPLPPGTTPAAHAQAIYDALTSVPKIDGLPNKVLVKVECASHAMVWEGCDPAGCTPPHLTLKNALIGWIQNQTFNDGTPSPKTTGKFTVKTNGQVTPDP